MLVRAAGATALALGLVWLVTAASDEGGISWGERAGRALPLTPVCAAIGAWAALAPIRRRGETVAMAALGRSRAQVGAAAVAGAALVSLVAAVAVGLMPAVDATAFFPRAAHASTWVWQGGSFVDLTQGLLVDAGGAPVPLAAKAWTAASILPNHGRAAAAVAVAVAGVALPLLLAHPLLGGVNASASQGGEPDAPAPRGRGLRHGRSGELPALLASGGVLAASTVLFQAAAGGRVPALLGAAPPVLLLAFALERYRTSP